MGTYTEAYVASNNRHHYKSRLTIFQLMSAKILCTMGHPVNASLQQRTVHRSKAAHSFSSVTRKRGVLWKLKTTVKVEPPEPRGK